MIIWDQRPRSPGLNPDGTVTLLHGTSEEIRGKRGFGIGRDPAGNPELSVLWLRGVAIPPFPSSVDGAPIVIHITPPIVARKAGL
jgi:hypothetical protein